MTEGEDNQPTLTQEKPSNESYATSLLGVERQAWAAAIKSALNDDEDEYSEAPARVLSSLAYSGDEERAREIARNAKGDYQAVDDVERAMVGRRLANGDIKGALEIIHQGKSDYLRTDLIQWVAETQAKSGDLQGAITTAKELDDSELYETHQTLYFVAAKKQAIEGNVSEAKSTIEAGIKNLGLDDPHEIENMHSMQSAVALGQAESGDIEGAKATLNEYGIAGELGALPTYNAIVEKLVRNGEYAAAYQLKKSVIRSVQELARGSDDDTRTQIVRLTASQKYLGDLGLQIAIDRARHGDYDTLLDSIYEERGVDRLKAVTEVLEDKDVRDIPQRVITLVNQTLNENIVTWPPINNLIVALAKRGFIDEAMRVDQFRTNQIRPETQHVFGGLAEIIVRQMAERGDYQGALKFIREHTYKSNDPEALAALASGLHHFRETHGLVVQESNAIGEALGQSLSADRSRRLGGAAVEQWRDFKKFKPVDFARLAHGAAEIAHAYMTDEERRAFIRDLAGEFRQFRDKGMFEDGQHQAVLKHMTEALIELDDPAATGHLLETLNKNLGEATGLRLIKTLVESGNAKAGAAGIAVFCDEDTPEHVYSYLLHKLAKVGYVDADLPKTIIEYNDLGRFSDEQSRMVIQRFYSELNVQMDSQLLKWVISKYYSEPDPPELDDFLDQTISFAEQNLNEFEKLDQKELLEQLAGSSDKAAIYFMLKSGRTKYTLIQHYNFSKFKEAVAKAAEVQSHVSPELIDRRLWGAASSGWYEAMVNRRRPNDNLVWQVEVGSAQKELREQARNDVNEVLGFELGWLLRKGLSDPNFSGYNEGDFEHEIEDELKNKGKTSAEIGELQDQHLLTFFFGEKGARKLESIFGDTISRAVNFSIGAEVEAPSIGDFEKAKNALLAQLRQSRQNAKSNKDPLFDKWKDLIEQVEQEDPVIAMRHILTLLTGNPDFSLHPKGAVAEWTGHFAGLATTIRDSQRKSGGSRNITMRYLDGKNDFSEMLRFADGAQCCFTSENTAGVVMDPGGEWRMRINRDPHWFVFSIEDTPPDAETRVSSGFIFGSIAWVDGEPALALNGVYMQRKTSSAANEILEQVTERLARPLGVKYVLVGSTFGGEFDIDKSVWQPAGGRIMRRPRAIATSDGSPEDEIYDDLGDKVNTEQEVPDHCWIRTV
jgi:hypothetical protein